MECDTETTRVPLVGAGMSPKKTPLSPKGAITTPESDCNSNNLNLKNDVSTLYNNEKAQDCHNFIQDNSEYQWFLDYGYKDSSRLRHSVFSVLSSHDMMYYDDLSRDLDANLAEVDMDDFHKEDIHSILSTLPNMCSSDMQGVEEREMFASVSESMMIKFGFDSSSSPHSSSQEENSASVSMCKSELLFSPVHESYFPNGNLSVDSLDLSEQEINLLITCQANKNNYTIAFEGSTIIGSDDSVCHETGESGDGKSNENPDMKCSVDVKQCPTGKHNFSSNINNSMARSDSLYTTWSKIKQRSNEHLQMKRQPSGNNNPATETCEEVMNKSSSAIKSLSLPNLFRQRQKQKLGMPISGRFSGDLSSPINSEQHCVKLYDIQKSNNCDNCGVFSTRSADENNRDRPHNFNLVKLFIKQKSASHEGMCNYAVDRSLCASFGDVKKSEKDVAQDTAKEECTCNSNHSGNNPKGQAQKVSSMKNTKMHDCSISGFEDSLVSRNVERNEVAPEKENSDSESVEQITESCRQISESVEQITESCSASENFHANTENESSHKSRQRVNGNVGRGFNENNNNSVLDNQRSKYSSDGSAHGNGSNTESAENVACNCHKTRPIRTKMNIMEKSIQTSKLLESCGPNTAKQVKVPAYILYPSYTLPDLEFLKEKHYVQNIDFTKIFLRPQTFKETPETATQSPKKRAKAPSRRPMSVNDIETLKKTGFKHVRDWDSLTFLLPKEYKRFLQEIPEIVAQLKDMKNMKEDLKPLFCLNNPSRKIRKRPISCDSNFFAADCRSSNYSSTATQPSSGYRGSSTMLNSNNSNATPSPRNPSYGFRYDNNDSVLNSRKVTPPKSGSLLNSEVNEEVPGRHPPAPRSILRNNSLDNTKYTCKTQKDNANKRYSMIEFGERNHEVNDKAGRRRSTQDPYYLKSPQRNMREAVDGKGLNEFDVSNFCQRDGCDDGSCLSFKNSSLESDMRRLEELLEISAVFGENIESFSESDMLKLRSQVSKFLTMQKNLQKVSECLQTVNESQVSSASKVDGDGDLYKEKRLTDVKCSQTPNNTPEHKKKPRLAVGEEFGSETDTSTCLECNGEDSGNCSNCRGYERENNYRDETLRSLKKTVSFAEKISFLMKGKDGKGEGSSPSHSPSTPASQPAHKMFQGKGKLMDVPISEESCEGSPSDSPKRNLELDSSLTHKKGLILDVKNAVEKILNRSKVKNEKTQEELSNLCLHHLCPSIYSILSDGLREETDTPFGPIRNSVWSVIEASSHQGPLTETLNQLVQRLNRDDVLTEGLVKFNAFIFGLLNANSLDAWLSYLRTRDGLLHKYYSSKGLLLLSNSAGAPVRTLMDQLIQIVQPLSGIKFGLDLLYQAKLLHCSLQNLNCLLETNSDDLLSPTKHLMLLKLVQSIQNSINQSAELRKSRQTSDEAEKFPGEAAAQEKVPTLRAQGPSRPRPRSGCEILSSDGGTDVAGSVKKRWSGVQFNSKLSKAFERLGEETESEYTDSLDNNPRGGRGSRSPSTRNTSKRLQNSDDTLEDLSRTWTNDFDASESKTKEQRKNILSNLNKKNFNRLGETKTDIEGNERLGGENTSPHNQNGGHKFKRLQQKWEKLSGKSSPDCSSTCNTPSQGMSPAHRSKIPTPKRLTPEKASGDLSSTLTSPTSRISRIPRPVSSPVQAAGDKQNGVNTRKLSSLVPSVNNAHQKGSKNYSSGSSNLGKTEVKAKVSSASRLSRFDEVLDANSDASACRSRPVRPSSLPYRGVSTMPAKKSTPTRASSMSLNRRPEKKPQRTPRVVRTLSHRLPSDSGHLSFNEGEKLKVVLEVDETWFLCCRGTQKGLVPKSAVIPVPEHLRY